MQEAGTLKREFSTQGVRIFYTAKGCIYDDGEINGAGWYIQQMSMIDGKLIGTSDGIGPFDSFNLAVEAIALEFGEWKAPDPDSEDERWLPETEPFATPDQ